MTSDIEGRSSSGNTPGVPKTSARDGMVTKYFPNGGGDNQPWLDEDIFAFVRTKSKQSGGTTPRQLCNS